MSAPNCDFLTNPDLPSHNEIKAMCLQQMKDGCRGSPLYKAPNGPIVAWVKHGGYVTVAEALTQDWVARTLGPAGPVRVPRVYDAWETVTFFGTMGYIVMEYIDAPDCQDSDTELVAKAVECLIGVQAPNSVPGPVGGGPVIYPFFFDWGHGDSISYHTVGELQDHVNGILQIKNVDMRVDFATDDFCLCPGDITPGNFKKDRDGNVIALDFGATCFLPRSFLDFSMRRDRFAQKVAKCMALQPSNNVGAMGVASTALVPFGRNTIGLPRSICKRMSHT